MAKHTCDDAVDGSAADSMIRNMRTSKKIRKRSNKSKASISEDQLEAEKVARKLKRQLEKLTPVILDGVQAVSDMAPETDSAESARKAGKSRKALKRAQRGHDHDGDPLSQADFDITDQESAWKSEKARKKALKRAQKDYNHNREPSSQEVLDNTEQESAMKAERARKKALRRANKYQNYNREPLSLEPAALSPKSGVSNSLYIEDAALTALPKTEIDAFLSNHFISVTDSMKATRPLRPITRFAYLPITDPAQRASFNDFEAPTPIQAAAWPFLFAGRDLIGVAETGSGKTMAFAVPCVRQILSLPSSQRNKGARAVIVSPTRELAMQSYEQIIQLCNISGLRAVCVYGGVGKDEQRMSLRTADIVVATPGRLNDLIKEGCADLSKAKYVVLDEADRMLDKGFEEEIKKIISSTPCVGERQTLMFTATWPESVRSIAATFMKSPVKIIIGDNPSGDLRANARIVQKVEVVDPRNKEFRLLQTLKEHQSGSKKDDRIIVFALYKKEAMRVESFIRSKGFRVVGIHGDLSQEQRTRSLGAFKEGSTPILVATDVAARGLDIPSVKLVVNMTFPLTVEDYVHRIGRTGRAGKEGLAITLFTEHDKSQSGALINVLKAAKQEIPEELLKFGTTVKRKEHEAYGAFARDVDMSKKAKKIKFD